MSALPRLRPSQAPSAPDDPKPPEPIRFFDVELAAGLRIAKDVGSTIILSCLDPETEDASLLKGLSNPEYAVLQQIAASASYNTAAANLGKSASTVRQHLSETYRQLGVDSKQKASRYIPIDVVDLDAFQAKAWRPDGSSVLTDRPRKVFDLLGKGQGTNEIASALHIGATTVRTHASVIRGALGLSLDKGSEGSDVRLGRIAGGLANLERYQKIAGEVSAIVQPHTADALSRAEVSEQEGGLDLDAPVVRRVSNSDLLADLKSGRFIDEASAASGELNLEGLVAAILLKRQATGPKLRDEFTAPIARAIIQKETARFLSKRQQPSPLHVVE